MVKLSEKKAGDLLKCNKCGFCLAHCPIYKVTGVEWASARGRISLISSALLDNRLDIKELDDPVFNCLTCNACADDCPAGVQTAGIIFNTREEIHRSTWLGRWIFQRLLSSPSLLQKAANALRFADMAGIRPAARKTGLIKLIGDAGKAEVMVPRVPPRAGLSNIMKLTRKIENPECRVAFFPGCYTSNLAPGEAASTIRILQGHQVEVVIPEFVCCGMPAPAYGEISSARRLARQNIEIAGKMNVDAIITSCASCSSFLKEYGKLLEDDSEMAEKAGMFAGKVQDLNEFLVNIGLPSNPSLPLHAPYPEFPSAKVTYHDPCHLARYQKIRQQPRTMLKSIPGIEFIELKEADMCCGAAGSYSLKNYDLSMKVLERKMDNIEKSGADILVSSCPACLMQISSGARARKMSLKVVSLVELLDRATGQKRTAGE